MVKIIFLLELILIFLLNSSMVVSRTRLSWNVPTVLCLSFFFSWSCGLWHVTMKTLLGCSENVSISSHHVDIPHPFFTLRNMDAFGVTLINLTVSSPYTFPVQLWSTWTSNHCVCVTTDLASWVIIRGCPQNWRVSWEITDLEGRRWGNPRFQEEGLSPLRDEDIWVQLGFGHSEKSLA